MKIVTSTILGPRQKGPLIWVPYLEGTHISQAHTFVEEHKGSSVTLDLMGQCQHSAINISKLRLLCEHPHSDL